MTKIYGIWVEEHDASYLLDEVFRRKEYAIDYMLRIVGNDMRRDDREPQRFGDTIILIDKDGWSYKSYRITTLDLY